MSIQGPSRQKVYDPNDVARTTIKETNIDNNRTGNLGNRDILKSIVYDPNDIAKVTMKQTSMMKNSTGNIQRQDKNTAYIDKKNKLVAPNTHRQSPL